MYLHTPVVEAGSWWRVDTASGSDTGTTVYAYDGTGPIPNYYVLTGSTVRNTSRDGTARFWSATQTLYLKELTYQGVPNGTVVTSTGSIPAAPVGGAPVDIATIATTVAALPSTYVQFSGALQATQVSTSSDASTRTLASTTPAAFGPIAGTGYAPIVVDPGSVYQPIIGFGAAITGASAYVLRHYLTAAQRTALLTELFSPSGLNLSIIRVPMGSSDFDPVEFSYDDQPLGSTDSSLTSFSIARDETDKIPVIQEILRINPRVKVIATPWSPPAWMKTTPSVGLAPYTGSSGNTFDATYWTAYANYFVKFIQAYANHGIPIWGVTPQNEPGSGAQGWPCLSMSAANQITFVGTYLGPAIDTAGLDTRIICFDQNWSGYTYADTVLADATAASYIDGISWHWYAGVPEGTQSLLARKYPTKAHYLLEACDSSVLAGTMASYHRYIFVGSMRAGSRCAVLWNLALDENGRPNIRQNGQVLHGLVTVPSSGSGVLTRTADYYALAQTSKYVTADAYRIGSSSDLSGVMTVAYANPDGTIVLVAYNSTGSSQTIQIIDARVGQGFPATLPAGEVATFAWRGAPVGTTTPTIATPGAVTASATTATDAVTVSWTDGSTGDAPISGYLIQSGSSAVSLTPLATAAAGATSYSDSTASATAATYYTVTAINAGGAGTASSVASATATSSDSRSVAAPTTLTRPSLWLRADKMGLSNGASVTSWTDTSGRGLHATVPSGGAAPTIVTAAINSLPVIRFNGTATQKLVAPYVHAAENLHVLIVARLTQVTTAKLWLASCDSTGANKVDTGFNAYYDSTAHLAACQIWKTGNTFYAGAGSPNSSITVANTPFVARVNIDRPGGQHAVKAAVNGGEGSAAIPGTYGTVTTATGLGFGNIASDTGGIDVAEVIVLKNPTAAEVHTWTTYLGQVYGITITGSN